jgi:hypothetical protein
VIARVRAGGPEAYAELVRAHTHVALRAAVAFGAGADADRVYPSDRAGVVWIHTAREMESQRGYWHQARQPAELSGLFKKLGLMGKKSGGAGVAEYPPAWDDGQSQDQGQSQKEAEPATAPAAAPASDDTTTGWWWAIPGLAAGAALTLVLRPLASRLPRPPFGRGGTPEPGPRQQLLDG